MSILRIKRKRKKEEQIDLKENEGVKKKRRKEEKN